MTSTVKTLLFLFILKLYHTSSYAVFLMLHDVKKLRVHVYEDALSFYNGIQEAAGSLTPLVCALNRSQISFYHSWDYCNSIFSFNFREREQLACN